jgi:hypothetical protein
MCLWGKFLENGKVEGIAPTLADDFFRMPFVDHVIVEADGAAGRPLKAPADHEPVIPQSTTLVIALLGLSALGKPLGPEVVFRIALFKALTGLQEGDILTPEKLSKAFDEKAGLFKNATVSARRAVFLNQLDTLADPGAAWDLARSRDPGTPSRGEGCSGVISRQCIHNHSTGEGMMINYGITKEKEMENGYQSWLWEKLGEKCVKNLKKHGFDAHFAATPEEAKTIILKMVSGFETFGFGGSDTTRALGIVEALKDQGKTLLITGSRGFPRKKIWSCGWPRDVAIVFSAAPMPSRPLGKSSMWTGWATETTP